MKAKIGTIFVIFIALVLAIVILTGLFYGVPYFQERNQKLRDTFSFISIDGGIKILGYSDDILLSNNGNLVIPNRINGKKVIEIGKNAFAYNSYVKTVTIPSTVKYIGDRAFYDCENLEEVEFGTNVESIGERAFALCEGLKEVNIPKKVSKIKTETFLGCHSLTFLTIHENVKVIEKNAFSQCTNLNNVEFENNNGWQLSNGNIVVDIKLTSSLVNANYVTMTYTNYIWLYVG